MWRKLYSSAAVRTGRPPLHQALGDEGLEVAAERAARLGREQFPDRLHAEVLADDGRAGEHAACSRPKALQARRQQSLDRGRQHRPDLALGLLAERDRQLLKVERIAASGLKEPCSSGRRDALIPGQGVKERRGWAFGEWRELDGNCPVCLGRPGRTLFKQFRAGDADQDERRSPRLNGEGFHEVEEGRFGPVQVLEDDQQRPGPRKRFKKPAGRPEDLGGVRPALVTGAESVVSRSATSPRPPRHRGGP